MSENTDQLRKELIQEKTYSHLLQAALTPNDLSIGCRYELASEYLPAFPGQDISGDTYDAFLTKKGSGCALIGDVAGKGIQSAGFAASARITIRAFAHTEPSMGKVLTSANSVLCAVRKQRYDLGLFVTVCILCIDVVTGRICYSTAGHPPPAIYRAKSRTVQFLHTGNIPLGILDDYQYEEWPESIDIGDKVVFYTDGVTEARHGPELLEVSGVERCVQENGHLEPSDLIQCILKMVQEWRGDSVLDDTAILVLGRIA